MSPKSEVERRVKAIKRNTRKKYSAEEKIRIILEGLRGEETSGVELQDQTARTLEYFEV